MQPFKFLLTLFAGSFCITACDVSTDSGHQLNKPSLNSANASLLFGGNGASLMELLNAPQAKEIAASFPTPTLPAAPQAFKPEPEQRFEQWTLSALTQSNDTDEWRWIEQQFVRVALAAEANVESNWAFRDVMMHQFQRYDFQTEERETLQAAERRALSLSDVTEESVFVRGVSAQFHSQGCSSKITLKQPSEHFTWNFDQCPQRTQIGSTVIANAFTQFENGVGWVTHTYGQLPKLTGPVIIEELRVVMPDNQQLRITRSRRRSGTGPVTVSAAQVDEGRETSLRDALWEEEAQKLSPFPASIKISLPTLSRTLLVQLPKQWTTNANDSPLGVQHGVLVKSLGNDESVYPGLIRLFPRR